MSEQNKKNIYFASDHAGFSLKQKLIQNLSYGISHDLGPFNEDRTDYPDYASKLCKLMTQNDFGVLVCGSGIGMCIMANRFPYIRAALCQTVEAAKLSRQHNDANVLCLGARLTDSDLAVEIMNIFLTTPFEGGRHEARVSKLFYRP